MKEYKIDKIHYRDLYGNFLWSERMIFKRLYSVGQTFRANGKDWLVKRIAVVNKIQHLNINVFREGE